MRQQIADADVAGLLNGGRGQSPERNGKHPPPMARLVERLVDVMRRTAGLGRTGTARPDGQREFSFFAAPDVFEAVRRELAQAGVLLRPRIGEIRDTAAAGRRFVTVLSEYTLIDCETGDEITIKGAGRGDGAKHDGLSAARTGALKHALVRNFLLSDPEDPDLPRGACRAGAAGPPADEPPPAERPRRKRGRKRATSLHGKLLEAIRAVGEVPRTGEPEAGGYCFVTIDDLVGAIRPELVRRGVHLSTSVESVEDAVSGDGMLTRVSTRHVFRDAETGQSMELLSAGEAAAGGEAKSAPDERLLYRAVASSFKYALLEFLLVANTAPARPRAGKIAAMQRRLGITLAEIREAADGDWASVALPGEPEAGRPVSEASPPALETHLGAIDPSGGLSDGDRRLARALIVGLAKFSA